MPAESAAHLTPGAIVRLTGNIEGMVRLRCVAAAAAAPAIPISLDGGRTVLSGPDGQLYRLVDTAGLRKRAKVDEGLERMSTSSSIEALKRAEMVVLAIDATVGVEDQDLHIARLIEREGRACVIALTKWDAVDDRGGARQAALERISISLSQMKGITVVCSSMPPALPQIATLPYGLITRERPASMSPPTLSIAPAQCAFSSGRCPQ